MLLFKFSTPAIVAVAPDMMPLQFPHKTQFGLIIAVNISVVNQ